MVRFPRPAGPAQGGKAAEVEGLAPVVGKGKKAITPPADGMLPEAARALPNPHVPVQGNSLIARTLRYDQVQIGKSEAKLAPLVAQMQSNGWFPPETLAAIARAGTKEEIVGLIEQSPGGITAFVAGYDLARIATDIMKSPAAPGTVLMMNSGALGLERFGGALARSAANDLRDVTMTVRHYDNTSPWLEKGFARYTSLDQLTAARDSAMSDGVKQLWAALAPLTLADIHQMQTDYQAASQLEGSDLRKATQNEVLDRFAQTLSRLPEPLWAELRREPDVRDDMKSLARRGSYGTDWEQARSIVSLFRTNGENGAALHGLFSKGIDLESFIGGGFIPDKVSRGAGELW